MSENQLDLVGCKFATANRYGSVHRQKKTRVPEATHYPSSVHGAKKKKIGSSLTNNDSKAVIIVAIGQR